MGETLRIPLDQLRAVFQRIADHLAEIEGPSVEVDYDYFWSIPPEEMYDPFNVPQPENLTMGQAYDSWSFLEGLLAETRGPVAYDLVWLADVLKAIGHQGAGNPTSAAERQRKQRQKPPLTCENSDTACG